MVSITLFSMHAWLKWEDAAIASLALEVVDFNLVPIIIYTVTRWVTCHLHCLVVSGVLHLARRLGAQNAANRNKYWVAACTCLLHVALSGTVMKVLLKGPLQMPAGLNPFELLDAGKLCLLGMLQRMNLLTVTRMVSVERPTASSMIANDVYSWHRIGAWHQALCPAMSLQQHGCAVQSTCCACMYACMPCWTLFLHCQEHIQGAPFWHGSVLCVWCVKAKCRNHALAAFA